MKRRSCIVKALQKMGFKPHQIEVSDTAMSLRGYRGDTRGQKAQIRIKGSGWAGENYVGGSSNDLGFEEVEDGSYVFHVSDYDVHKYNEQWQSQFMDEYARSMVHEICDEQNFFLESETEEDGEIVIRLTSPF
jgi:hypothetical protein